MDLSAYNLPDSVVSEVRFFPYEDILIEIFKRGLPDVPFYTYIAEDMSFPAVHGQRFAKQRPWSGDPRFIDSGPIRINVFTTGLNAEIEGGYISEAIRNVFLRAHLERWHFPDVGSVLSIQMESEPAISSDWASASGIVQFADLPPGVVRTETAYNMTIRRPN